MKLFLILRVRLSRTKKQYVFSVWVSRTFNLMIIQVWMNSDQKIGTQLGKALKRKDFTSSVSRQAFESGFFQSSNLPRTSVRINLVLSRVEFKYYRFACCHVPKNLFAQCCQISDTIFFERLKLVQKNLASSKLLVSQVLVL